METGKKDMQKYRVEDQNLLWYEFEKRRELSGQTSTPLVPRCFVVDWRVLVHCQHGHNRSSLEHAITCR